MLSGPSGGDPMAPNSLVSPLPLCLGLAAGGALPSRSLQPRDPYTVGPHLVVVPGLCREVPGAGQQAQQGKGLRFQPALRHRDRVHLLSGHRSTGRDGLGAAAERGWGLRVQVGGGWRGFVGNSWSRISSLCYGSRWTFLVGMVLGAEPWEVAWRGGHVPGGGWPRLGRGGQLWVDGAAIYEPE